MKNIIDSFLNYDKVIKISKEMNTEYGDSLVCQYTVLEDDTYITLAVDTDIPTIDDDDYDQTDMPIMVIYYGDIYFAEELGEENYIRAIEIINDLLKNNIKKKVDYRYYESLEDRT